MSCRVYGCCGLLKICVVVPASTTLPAYMIDALVAGLGHDREVVADEDERQVELLAQARDEVEDLGLDHDVERRGRLVTDDQLGIARERHGDHRPLAHAARHLVRVLGDRAWG